MIVCAFALIACDGVAPERISIETEPLSLNVPQGSTIDLTGGSILVHYADASTKTIPMDDLEVRGLNANELGEQTIVLVYKENGKSFSTTLTVNVVLSSVSALMLNQENVKVEYFDGDTFDPTGLQVKATFDNGTEADIEAYEITPLKLTPSVTRVAIKYRGVTAYLPVTVHAKAAASLVITTYPTKTSYFVGDGFVSDGIDGYVVYNDGTKELFSKCNLIFYHADGTELFRTIKDVDDKTVKVLAETDFGSAAGTLDLNVTAVLPSRLVPTVNIPLVFFEGESFDMFSTDEAVTFTITFNNGIVADVIGNSQDFVYSDAPLTYGTRSVRVSYRGTTTPYAEVPVTVNKILPTSIWIYSQPNKKEYYSGDSLDLTGLTLGVENNNGETTYVDFKASSGITADVTTVTGDAGDFAVQLTYKGQTTQLNLLIEDRPVLSVVNLTVKNESSILTTYSVGESFVFSNAIFTFRLSNGQDLDVPYQNATVTYTVNVEDEEHEVSIVNSTVAVADMVAVTFHVIYSDANGEYASDVYLPITLA